MSSISTINPRGNKALPAAFAGVKAAEVFQGKTFEKTSEGIEGSYGILKYPGKNWKLTYRGETKTILRKDDGSPRATVDLIFLRSAHSKAKTYYEGGFKEGSKDRPTCWSNDGKKPDPAVIPSQRGASACAICPKNVVGSKMTPEGKPARLCSDHKRTAVLLDPVIAMETLGIPLDEPILLRIPAASLVDYATFGDMMDTQGFPVQAIITRVGFDHDKNYPKLTFDPVRPLDDVEGKIALALRDDLIASRIVTDSGVVSEEEELPPNPNQTNGNGAIAGGAMGQTAPMDPVQQGAAGYTNGNVVTLQRQTPEQQVAQMVQTTQTVQTQGQSLTPEQEQAIAMEADIDAQISKLLK